MSTSIRHPCTNSIKGDITLSQCEKEINRRYTSAIISYPDAGKTIPTEKFLFYDGAIAQAGQVKNEKNTRAATSNWMEIERQRGILTTSSVIQFRYEDYCINILDTPGHQNFSEDTYHTLMAADSTVMVIDAAKGVGARTRKLFGVCAMQDILIPTFINKMDQEIRDSFELLEELEEGLGIEAYPVNWPVDCGKDLKGVYDRDSRRTVRFTSNGGAKAAIATEMELGDPNLDSLISERFHRQLTDEIELLNGAVAEFGLDRVRHDKLSPMFFGPAPTNFGMEPFLEHFLQVTIAPLPRWTGELVVDSLDDDFSALMFKIQANVGKAHQDRITSMHIVSGRSDADKEVYHVQGDKKLYLSRPQQLIAAEREIIEEAYAGDIIGVSNPGILSIGDTLYAPGKKFHLDPIPTFALEHFGRVRSLNIMKCKQFLRGMEQITQEGATQTFKTPYTGMEEVVMDVVGTLQFDVLEYRLKNEHNVELYMEGLPYEYSQWIETDDGKPIKEEDLILDIDVKLVEDYKGNQLLLLGSQWTVGWTEEWNENLTFHGFSGTRF